MLVEPLRQIVVQDALVDAGRTTRRQQRLDLRGEEQASKVPREIERLDAHAIAGAEQASTASVPQGEGEHTVEMLQAIHPPTRISGQQDFRVRLAAIGVVRQLTAQLEVVVDFAVEDQLQGAVVARHGLTAVLAEVDDAQAVVPQSDAADAAFFGVAPHALPIGPAMAQGLHHGVHLSWVRTGTEDA